MADGQMYLDPNDVHSALPVSKTVDTFAIKIPTWVVRRYNDERGSVWRPAPGIPLLIILGVN